MILLKFKEIPPMEWNPPLGKRGCMPAPVSRNEEHH